MEIQNSCCFAFGSEAAMAQVKKEIDENRTASNQPLLENDS